MRAGVAMAEVGRSPRRTSSGWTRPGITLSTAGHQRALDVGGHRPRSPPTIERRLDADRGTRSSPAAPPGGQLEGQRLGRGAPTPRFDGAVGGRVGLRPSPRRSTATGHDRPLRLDQVRAIAAWLTRNGPVEVDRQVALPVGEVERPRCGPEAHDAGAVDHQVEPAVALDHAWRPRSAHRGPGRSTSVGQHADAVAGQVEHRRRVAPSRGQQPGGGRADARRGARRPGRPCPRSGAIRTAAA